MLNEDYKDILSAFSEEKVRFLLVGAYAMAAHGRVRSTTDIDLWVEASEQNARLVEKALIRFGAPMEDISAADFVKPGSVVQIGVAPERIDILTSIEGVDFDEAYGRSRTTQFGDIETRVLSLDDLIINKRATGRLQDLADVEALEKLQNMSPLSE